jgi:addiction module RelE/StbE family toxin
MARRIVWSKRSIEDRKDIYSYWNQRNSSKAYSRKLNQFFIASVELLSVHPKLGRTSSKKGVRIKVVRDYLLLYEFDEKELRILTIFGSRQDPRVLKNDL